MERVCKEVRNPRLGLFELHFSVCFLFLSGKRADAHQQWQLHTITHTHLLVSPRLEDVNPLLSQLTSDRLCDPTVQQSG